VKSVTGARHTAFIGRLIVAVVCTLGWLLAAGPSAVAAQPLAPEASGLVTLSLHDADAKSVFTLLAELAGLNLVVDPAVQVPVTISLREVPVREAIALSAKAARASAVITGDLLVVSAVESMEGDRPSLEAVLTNVYMLQHVEPSKVVELANLVVPTLKVSGDETTKRLVARGTMAEQEEFAQFLSQFDRPLRQVLIEARVEEVSRESARSLGVRWSIPKISAQWNAEIGSLPFSVEKLEAQLDALEETGHARLLARPNITAVSGEKATIFVGDRIPIVLKGGPEERDRIEYIEAGIQLEIVARVGDDGLITTHVKPQVSSIVGQTATEGLPHIRTRTAETTVRVVDGESIVIGGLIQEEDREGMAGLPGLGSLPIVGTLFQKDEIKGRQFETLIILTPHIVDGASGEVAYRDRVQQDHDWLTPLPAVDIETRERRFAPRAALSIALPASAQGEVALGWANQWSRWEMRLALAFQDTETDNLRCGLGWRIDDRWAWLRVGGDAVLSTDALATRPRWEAELAVGLNLTPRSDVFVEPWASMTWPVNSQGFGVMRPAIGLSLGVRN
jgi:type II secretory pathway component GspD/PulD (secretin)